MPVSNKRGIFKDKKALLLAIKYNLDINNKNSYIHSGVHITYKDVHFIVDNLWLDHFMYGVQTPIDVDFLTYIKFYNRLMESQ